jgi:hypothetical protein
VWEKLGVCDLTGEVGETAGSSPSFAFVLVVFNGLIPPSNEFLFGDLAGGDGNPPSSALVFGGARPGFGLVPR